MAVPKEVINTILYFDPGRAVVEGQQIDLGVVDQEQGIYAVYGNYPYNLRLVGAVDEPRLFGSTVQPVVALERRFNGKAETLHKFPYATEIREVGEALATKVADRLKAIDARRQNLAV